MKKVISSLKENIFLKLYLLLFSLINFAYVFFEVLKSRYVQRNLLTTTIEEKHFEYLSRISSIMSFLEILLISLLLIYLIITFLKKYKLNIKNFIIINFSLFISLFLINYIVSFVFSAPSGNLIQQLIIPFVVTVLISIYFTITTLYKKIMKIQSN